MSHNMPDKSDLTRSNIITLFLTVILLVVAILLWMWSAPDVIDTSPIGALNNFNPFVTFVVEILIMTGVFIFATVTVINLRLQLTSVRAGWLEVIIMFIVIVAISWATFGVNAAGATAILSLGFIAYLYLLQE
ncbi:MAG: hypothetical protein K9W43_09260 [Candidatus Thorarchaeota archaeon]|nr:hypothetical protein [Candidatus Thorarchaeota archaeon]